MNPVAWLPEKTNELLAKTGDALTQRFGDALAGAALVGLAMNPTRRDRARAPEVIAVAEAASLQDLPGIAAALRDPMRQGVRVRVISTRELDRSRDVFALELADWKARHHVVAGRDVFDELTFDRADLRRGVEIELRGLSRRIRNRVLTGLATSGGRDDPADAVLAGFDRLLVAAYHGLALLGEEQPREEPAILEALGARTGADATAVLAHLAQLRRGEGKLDAIAALADLLAFAEPFVELVDAMS